MKCEICKLDVPDQNSHWQKTKDRPDGYWICHPHVGKVRCAKCEHVWRPRTDPFKIPARCPSCGEDGDLFWADDGGWEDAAKAKSGRRGLDFDFSDDDL